MADYVHGIGYGNTSGIGGGYVPQRKGDDVEQKAEDQTQKQVNYEETQVDPNKVMDFLARNTYFMPVTETKSTDAVIGTDADVEERVASYMARFEEIYAIVQNDFPNNPEAVMNVVMDKLLGLV